MVLNSQHTVPQATSSAPQPVPQATSGARQLAHNNPVLNNLAPAPPATTSAPKKEKKQKKEKARAQQPAPQATTSTQQPVPEATGNAQQLSTQSARKKSGRKSDKKSDAGPSNMDVPRSNQVVHAPEEELTEEQRQIEQLRSASPELQIKRGFSQIYSRSNDVSAEVGGCTVP